MKTVKSLALMSAIALTGATALTACSSSADEVAEVNNPRYNSSTNEVLTNFVFNVSTGNGTTRQSSAATQATEDDLFRGIDNAVLFSLKQSGDGKHLATAATADKRYDFAQVLAPYTISSTNSRRVIETSLPLNTNTLLFYGKAVEGIATMYGGDKVNEVFGHLDEFSLPDDQDLSKVSFTLGKRLKGDNLVKYKQVEDLLSSILTALMNTNLAGTNHVAIAATAKPLDVDDMAPYGFDVATDEYPADLAWASYANTNGTSPMEPSHALYPLEKKLADVYREMTTIKYADGEVRAGSGYALRLVIHDLWTNINEVRCATPLNKPEAVAKYMAHRITMRLRKYFHGTMPNDGGVITDVVFRDPLAIIEELASDEWPVTADAKPVDFSMIDNNDNLNQFPYSFSMPYGAAHLEYSATKAQFSYVKNFNTNAMGSTPVTIENYTYPAELLYFGNSPIRVSNVEKRNDSYPQTVAEWDNDNEWDADWQKNSHVVSTTQAVAMQNDINYGTSLLKTTVRYGAATLNDNNHAIQKMKQPDLADTDEPDKQITVDNTSFQLTGVIVSGMAKTVGWDYLAKEGDTFSQWIYDGAISSGAIPAPGNGSSTPNYTLTFDNYRNLEHQDKVYIALEFINNSGEDFFGEYGMIRKDSHFYLIGELDPEKSGLAAIEWPEHHPLPPYNADGTSIKTKRVFMQDYMTSADFVIGANSLKHAYLTVPDLRYSSLTLGLSVDIHWSTGLNFNNIVLGGDE